MFKFWVEDDRQQKIELTHNDSFIVEEIDGLASSEATINTTKNANSDGESFNSSRVNTRPIEITVAPRIPIEDNRQKIYDYFITGKKVVMYFKNKNRDIWFEGYVKKIDSSLFEMLQKLIIEITCTDPYFKDRVHSIFDMSQTLDLFEFPFAIEEEGIEFSRIDKELTKSIYNAGAVETGLIIELEATGTVINPVIYNANTRESFGIRFQMQLGDLIRINTQKGNKKIELTRSGETSNIINNLMESPKWLQLHKGDNLFTYTCEDGEENLRIRFIYANLYLGV